MRILLLTSGLTALAVLILSCGQDKPTVEINSPYESLGEATQVASAAGVPLLIDFYKDT